MKPIKFRAWDGLDWVYLDLKDICDCISYADTSSLPVPFVDNDDGTDDFFSIYCLYTGLKDKHEKEIYEGHTVRIHGTIARQSTGPIKRVKSGFYIGGDGDWNLDGFNKYDIEIIGNVYGHPEK